MKTFNKLQTKKLKRFKPMNIKPTTDMGKIIQEYNKVKQFSQATKHRTKRTNRKNNSPKEEPEETTKSLVFSME